MDKEYKLDLSAQMKIRFEQGMTPRQALENALKDVCRAKYDLVSYDSSIINSLIETDVIEAIERIGKYSNEMKDGIWTYRRSIFGEEKRLTKYGRWLEAICTSYRDMSDKAYFKMVESVLKRIGVESNV